MNLKAKIHDTLACKGVLPLDDFMQMTLTAYYTRQDPLGKAGDFITAPEISQVFGELIGLWMADYCHRTTPAQVMELGAGRGTLLADALRACQKVAPAFVEDLAVHLLEISPPLRALQKKNLTPLCSPRWHDSLTTLPPAPTLFIANEFFDALPIKQFIKTEAGWHERVIISQDDKLLYDTIPTTHSFDNNAPLGTIVEQCPQAHTFIKQITRHLTQWGGACLIIDYGYSEGSGDTLQAMQNHKSIDPLTALGEADITAHVNFADLTTTAEAEGAVVYGPITQSDFLTRLGARERFQKLDKPDPLAERKLLDPAYMGTLFKVLALTAADSPPPAGFA